MDINGESSSSSTTTSGFKLFGKTIVMSEKDVGQDHVITAAAAEEEEEEEETSMSRSSNLEEETGSAKTTTTTTKAAQHLPCPRCKSKETKFCYFNNYNVNQPRHFCKACHRYWTAGGVLLNVPVGAGRRKNRAPLPSPQGGGDSGGGAEGGGGGGGMCLVGGRGDPDPGGWKCR